MNDLFQFYRAYGQSLAERLKVIGHTAEKKRFVFVEDLDNADELIRKAVTDFKYSANVLVWERFSEQLSNGRRDNYNTRPQGSLAVLRKPETNSVDGRAAAIDECRQAAMKVVALMLLDEQTAGSALDLAGIRFELDGQSGEPIPPLGSGWVGYGFSFDWLAPVDLSLTDDDLVSAD